MSAARSPTAGSVDWQSTRRARAASRGAAAGFGKRPLLTGSRRNSGPGRDFGDRSLANRLRRPRSNDTPTGTRSTPRDAAFVDWRSTAAPGPAANRRRARTLRGVALLAAFLGERLANSPLVAGLAARDRTPPPHDPGHAAPRRPPSSSRPASCLHAQIAIARASAASSGRGSSLIPQNQLDHPLDLALVGRAVARDRALDLVRRRLGHRRPVLGRSQAARRRVPGRPRTPSGRCARRTVARPRPASAREARAARRPGHGSPAAARASAGRGSS